jgi:hypothetical protein
MPFWENCAADETKLFVILGAGCLATATWVTKELLLM